MDARAFLSECLQAGAPPEAASRDTWPAWDSFAHLSLMLALEQRFGVALTDENVARFSSLAALEALFAERGLASAGERRGDVDQGEP